MNRPFRPVLLALIVCVLCLPACVAPTSLSRGNLQRGPYLQQATPTSIVVVWRTQGPIDPVVRFGEKSGGLTQEVRGEAITLRVSADVEASPEIPRLYKEPAEDIAKRRGETDPSTPANTYQYEAHLSGLNPHSK